MESRKTEIRIVAVFLAFLTLMLLCILRIYTVNDGEAVATARQKNMYKLKITDLRGTIFDRNLLSLTNNTKKTVAIVPPSVRAITAISTVLEGERLENTLKVLKSGKPVAVEVEKKVDCDEIIYIDTYVHNNSNLLCPQLIGYTNTENHGVTGIENAYDDILFTDESINAYFACDATGTMLGGVKAEITGDTSKIKNGVALTIDSSIQGVTKEAMKTVTSGAAVVMEIGTGKIRAMVSNPEFDVTNISESFKNENSPLVNKAIKAYNVGSAFKPCVAAATLEQKTYSSYCTFCKGSVTVGGHRFKCHKLSGHGDTNLLLALTFSCNSFFYEISQKVGANAIFNMASSLNFGNNIDIGRIVTDKGNLPTLSQLESSTALANLSIGQGSLLLSPVSILTLYEAIANGGVYHTPSVIEGTVKKGVLQSSKISAPTRVMSKQTADTIKEYLCNVLTEGTGSAAKTELCNSAGKTATAETGWKKNDRLVVNSWFCGFFPVENPKYVVTVLIEDMELNNTDGAPIFKKIADGITFLENQLETVK